jgi:hypothetical protein
VAVKWRDVSDLAPGLQNTVLIFGPDLIARQADSGNQWMEAHLKGVRDYHAALVKNGRDREAIVSILSRWTPVADPQVYTKMAFPYIDPNGKVNRDNLADLLRFFRDSGRISSSVDLEHVLDTRFVDSPVRKLGWYSV